jgi:hypothetical protein
MEIIDTSVLIAGAIPKGERAAISTVSIAERRSRWTSSEGRAKGPRAAKTACAIGSRPGRQASGRAR